MTFPGDRGVNWFSINISFREKRLALSKKWDSMEEGGKEDKEEAKPEVRADRNNFVKTKLTQ